MLNYKAHPTSLARKPTVHGFAMRRPAGRLLKLALALSSCLAVAACATATLDTDEVELAETNSAIPLAPPTALSAVDRTMISDIVSISQQIFTPIDTTLQFRQDDEDSMLQYFITEFALRGFGIQRVSADQGSNYFSYNRIEEELDNGETMIKFDTTIGAVNIGRDYTVPSLNTVAPTSPFRLAGTRVPVTVTDKPTGRFQRSDDPANATAVYSASLNLDDQAPPVISLLTSDLLDRVVDSQTQSTSSQALNSSRMEVNNLFFSEESNFTNDLDGFEQIDRQIVVFGNDSMILGNTNKLLLEQLVENRLGPEDLIGLVGCSNGPTSLDIGNEGLALGRAGRVTEALLSMGVPRDRILDEGCWAPVSAGEKFPSRGVVLEIWRKTL